MEKVETLTQNECAFISKLYWLQNPASQVPIHEVADKMKEKYPSEFSEISDQRQQFLAKEYLSLFDKIRAAGFHTADMKGLNLGWKNGHMIQVDLGFLVAISSEFMH